MATLKEHTQKLIQNRQASLDQAIKALELIDLLPPELQNLEGEADTGYYGEDLRVTYYKTPYHNKDIDILTIAKVAGVQGLSPKMGYSPDWWVANGTIMADGKKVAIYLQGLPKPPLCVIEEYQETVTKYKAICSETGEEIK
jgi:hypothetical protein